MYVATVLGYEKIVLLVNPFSIVEKNISQKASHSTKLIASTLTIVSCINIPRFWYPKLSKDDTMIHAVTELNVISNISWFIYMYALLDYLIPFLFSIIFGIILWIKVIEMSSPH